MSTETRAAGEMAGNRPERTLGLIYEASELLAKADFETSALVDNDADLRNLVTGSAFGSE